ncbi:MAG: TrmH family RNA methyltransferase [Bdellovibrionales bacterium]
MNEIASAQNAKFKIWASLLESRGIKKAGRALISGRKLVQEFLEQNPAAAKEVLFPPKAEPFDVPPQINAYSLTSPLFKELDVMGTKAPLLVVQTPELKSWTPGAPQGLELIVALSDPGNLGALLRSAEAFGVSRVILTEECSSPFLPKAIRASSGASFRLPILQTGSLADVEASPAFSLNMEGESLEKFSWPKDLYLILGEEGRGIPKSLAATSISIPMKGKVESLNAMAAASIALYSYRIRH